MPAPGYGHTHEACDTGCACNEGIERRITTACRARSILRPADRKAGHAAPVPPSSPSSMTKRRKALERPGDARQKLLTEGLRDAFRRLFITSHTCRQYFCFFWSNRDWALVWRACPIRGPWQRLNARGLNSGVAGADDRFHFCSGLVAL